MLVNDGAAFVINRKKIAKIHNLQCLFLDLKTCRIFNEKQAFYLLIAVLVFFV